MARNFSFFVRWRGGAGQIRGIQMADRLGGRVNPDSGYDNDICVYVMIHPWGKEPENSWIDPVDLRYSRLARARRNTSKGVIAISLPQLDVFHSYFKGRELVFIPEHHCNFDRELRPPDRPVEVVGAIGGLNTIQWPHAEVEKALADMGLRFVFCGHFSKRQYVVDFYKSIDIQIVFRTSHMRGGEVRFRNPLKLGNAGSYGIPTVAYPEPSYISEWKDECLWGNTIQEVMEQVKRLKEDRELYKARAAIAWEKSQAYHIDEIAKKYRELER